MKNASLSLILLLSITSLLFVNCTKDELQSLSTTRELLIHGTWDVDYYFAGQDKTAQFSGYSFNFGSDGTLTAVNASTTVTGTWSTSREGTGTMITMNLGQQAELTPLNTRWDVGSATVVSVGMKDSASSQLVFRKL
jgi:hypothetical protein